MLGREGISAGAIAYVERPPAESLRWAVKALWALEGHLAGEAAALPKPYVELVVSLGDGHRWRSPDRISSFRDGWITPLQDGPRYSLAHGTTSFVGARLEPDAAISLFGPLPIGAGAAPIPAADMLGPGFLRLRDRLGAVPRTAARLALLEDWLHARLAPLAPARTGPLRLLSRDGWRVDSLCDRLGLDDRAARRRFHDALGCSPKFWLRLHRLSAILACPDFQRGAEPLAATAARFGLADQAHLAREFRLLAGMPPSLYQSRRSDEGLRVAPTMAPAHPRRFFQAGAAGTA